MDFRHQVVVTTGAASGIAEACVSAFDARNAAVATRAGKPGANG